MTDKKKLPPIKKDDGEKFFQEVMEPFFEEVRPLIEKYGIETVVVCLAHPVEEEDGMPYTSLTWHGQKGNAYDCATLLRARLSVQTDRVRNALDPHGIHWSK